MKNLLLLAVATCMFVGCTFDNPVEEKEIKENYNVVVIDGCEYIQYSVKSSLNDVSCGFMAHKGNCKYCAKRAKLNK